MTGKKVTITIWPYRYSKARGIFFTSVTSGLNEHRTGTTQYMEPEELLAIEEGNYVVVIDDEPNNLLSTYKREIKALEEAFDKIHADDSADSERDASKDIA